MKKVLVIDIGGSNVKMMISREEKRGNFHPVRSSRRREMVKQIKKTTSDWDFDAVAIGFPAPVRDGKIVIDPKHLGKGWVGFDFAKALGKPVRVINDAALQALGSYRGKVACCSSASGPGSVRPWSGRSCSSARAGRSAYTGE